MTVTSLTDIKLVRKWLSFHHPVGYTVFYCWCKRWKGGKLVFDACKQIIFGISVYDFTFVVVLDIITILLLFSFAF